MRLTKVTFSDHGGSLTRCSWRTRHRHGPGSTRRRSLAIDSRRRTSSRTWASGCKCKYHVSTTLHTSILRTSLMYCDLKFSIDEDLPFRTQLCINTAIVYMQRFYMFHSFHRFHRNSIASASLFLAAKVILLISVLIH